MRRHAILATLIAAWAGPAWALVEPSAAGQVSAPVPDERDSRVRSVEYAPNAVIRVVGGVGQTTLIRFPVGMQIDTFLASDQDVMTGTVIEEEKPGQAPAAGGANAQGTGEARAPCSMTTSLQICIRNARFLAIKPLIPLTPQPLHVILMRPRGERAPEEIPVLFEIETPDPSTRARVASTGAVAMPSGFYTLNVTMPAPAPPPRVAASPAPRQAASRAPYQGAGLARTQPQPGSPAFIGPPAPPPGNRNYSVQGDASLAGVPGR